jgi:uncharacterized membrane protein
MAKASRARAPGKSGLLRLIPRHGAFVAGLVAGIVAYAASAFFVADLAVGLGANMMFLVYLGAVFYEVHSMTPEFLRRHADQEDVPVWLIFVVTLAIVGISALSLFAALNTGGRPDWAAIAMGMISVILGWFVVNTMAAMHYAHEYYESSATSPRSKGIVGGLGWPEGGEEPNGIAFVYIAYQIGSALQVADVCATSNRMRGLLTMHTVFAFLYNTLLVTAAVNVVVAIAGS